jgi:hypothetical protein
MVVGLVDLYGAGQIDQPSRIRRPIAMKIPKSRPILRRFARHSVEVPNCFLAVIVAVPPATIVVIVVARCGASFATFFRIGEFFHFFHFVPQTSLQTRDENTKHQCAVTQWLTVVHGFCDCLILLLVLDECLWGGTTSRFVVGDVCVASSKSSLTVTVSHESCE